MAEQTISQHRHHREFYTSKKISFITKETFGIIDTTVVDRTPCIDTGKYRNGHAAESVLETVKCKSNGVNTNGFGGGEPKSFIQQRVERLYGPGALAQGFFVTKRQQSHRSESETSDRIAKIQVDKHNKSMQDRLLVDDNDDNDWNMKQSASSPSLPVLRHLTPEFRAQLPTFSPRKGMDMVIMQKSTTLPQLKESKKLNGHHTKVESNHCNNSQNVPTKKANSLKSDSLDADVKDGHYFLKVLENEADRLLSLADGAKKELQENEQILSEDAKGFLRSAAGKAQLLVSQKMQQFKGLCTNNLTQVEGEAYPTTNEDLQGFWDMVMLQVDQVDALFKELDTLRANNWTEVVKKPLDSIDARTNGKSRSKPVQKKNVGNEEARAKREALRKQMIEDRRKAMREAGAKSKQKDGIEIFAPESS